jgi:hypothetical protein
LTVRALLSVDLSFADLQHARIGRSAQMEDVPPKLVASQLVLDDFGLQLLVDVVESIQQGGKGDQA